MAVGAQRLWQVNELWHCKMGVLVWGFFLVLVFGWFSVDGLQWSPQFSDLLQAWGELDLNSGQEVS